MTTILSILLSVVLSAQLDSTQLWIGDQSGLHLEATASAEDQVTFPVFASSLQEGIEVVEQSPVDTIATADGRTVYHQDLVVTSFKDSLFYINPIPFVVNGDTQYTNSLSLNVIQPFEMDTTDAITDIKPVMKPKIWWWGILRWVLLAILIAGLIVGGWFLYKWAKKFFVKEEVEPVDPELLRPCDEVALEFPMPVQRVHCDERVAANRGLVAFQRGPIVYSFEQVDQKMPLSAAMAAPDDEFSAFWMSGLFGRVVAIRSAGGLVAVPNFARLNRAAGRAAVWIPEPKVKEAKRVGTDPAKRAFYKALCDFSTL